MVAEFYGKHKIPIIDPDNPTDNTLDMLFPDGATYGLVQRNYELFPERCSHSRQTSRSFRGRNGMPASTNRRNGSRVWSTST